MGVEESTRANTIRAGGLHFPRKEPDISEQSLSDNQQMASLQTGEVHISVALAHKNARQAWAIMAREQ